jgi:hypothetical protein
MNLEFTNGNAILSLSQPREMEVIKVAALHYADRLAEAELANRNYHLGTKPTPGRNYDDRLTMRLGLSATTCYEYLRLDPKRGGLVGEQKGTKWIVTEEAVRAFEGRKKQAA